MFVLNSLRAKHDIFHDSLAMPGHGGLSLSFSLFDGYSPMLDGSIRVVGLDYAHSQKSEKSESITVTINVKASSASYKDNIRIQQQDNEITISTGGLSLLSYTVAPRLSIEVVVTLPRTIGNLEIKTLSLPIFLNAVEKAGDVILKTESSAIMVERVEARSLTVCTHSGFITFKDSSQQFVDNFIRVTNSSGGTALNSSILSPSLLCNTSSGTLGLAAMTTASEIKIKNVSGSINGEVKYSPQNTSDSTFENNSGSINVTLQGWTGYLTANSSSGGKHVGGQGLEKWKEGWKKGVSDSKATFITQSGAINVKIL